MADIKTGLNIGDSYENPLKVVFQFPVFFSYWCHARVKEARIAEKALVAWFNFTPKQQSEIKKLAEEKAKTNEFLVVLI